MNEMRLFQFEIKLEMDRDDKTSYGVELITILAEDEKKAHEIFFQRKQEYFKRFKFRELKEWRDQGYIQHSFRIWCSQCDEWQTGFEEYVPRTK
jgi:hypothetical protein